MIFDTHTHWGTVWEDRDGTDPSEWLKLPGKYNIEKAILMGHAGLMRNYDIKKSNDIIKETCVRSEGRLIPVATVHPDFGDDNVKELERCLSDLDMRGLKLHPWVQGFSTTHPVIDEMMRICGKYKAPVIFHDGTPCYSMSSQVGGLALRFPETIFVLGHSGLLELWRSAISYGKRCNNIILTLSGPHLAGLQAIVDEIPAERITWGSDYGFGWGNHIKYRLRLMDYVHMTGESRRKIMWENAMRLFRLTKDA